MSKPTQLNTAGVRVRRLFCFLAEAFSKREAQKQAMTEPQVDQRVQLTQDIPELGLLCGEVGLVCSTWFMPATAYEVEFQRKMPDCWIRALLMPNQITDGPDRH